MKKTVILTEAELKELISETVNEVKTNVLEEYVKYDLEQSFRRHMFAEFYYRGHIRSLLENYDKATDIESQFGLFNGAGDIARYIHNCVMSMKVGETKTFQINKEFIGSVEIKLIDDKHFDAAGAFDAKTSSLMVDRSGKLLYSPLCITFNRCYLNGDYEDIMSTILHELIHSYEDYCRMLNKQHSMQDMLVRTGITKYMSIPNLSPLDNDVRLLFYYMNDSERNAHVGGMVGELGADQHQYSSIEDIIDRLKQTEQYKKYENFFIHANMFLYITNPDEQKKVLESVERVTNFKFTNYKKFKNYLKKKMNTAKNKFNTIIPKVAYKHLQFGMPPNGYRPGPDNWSQ